MPINSTQKTIQTIANGLKVYVLLSLMSDAGALYGYINDPHLFQSPLPLALMFVYTVLTWQFASLLKAGKQQALYCWFALVFLQYFHWIFVDGSFSLSAWTIIAMVGTIFLTIQIRTWTMNKPLDSDLHQNSRNVVLQNGTIPDDVRRV